MRYMKLQSGRWVPAPEYPEPPAGTLRLKKGGGGGGGVQTSTTRPPEFQQRHIDRAFEDARRLYLNNNLEYYPGQTVADQNAAEQAAQSRLSQYARGGAQQGADSLLSGLQYSTGEGLDVGNNPYVQRSIEAAIRPTTDTLMREILPSIRTNAAATGNVGSSRQGIAEGLAISDANRQSQDTAARMMGDAYQAGLGNLGRALAAGPQTIQAGSMPAGYLGQVGAAERSYEQALIDENIQRYNFEQQAPYTELQQYLNVIGQNFGGTTTTQNTQGGVSGGNSVLGGLGTGLSAYAMGANPWLAGAIGGLSMLSNS